MANYSDLKTAIQQVIKTNGNNEITGAILQQSLLSMINSLGAGYQFMGVATPSTNPGTPDQKVFYIAVESGNYANFGLDVNNTVCIFKYSEQWTKEDTGIANDSKLINVLRRVNSFISQNHDYSVTFSSTGVKQIVSPFDIFIPAGKKMKIKVTGTAEWTRLAIFGNTGTWTGDWNKDNIVKNTEYEISANVDITAIYVYLVSATNFGTVNINVQYEGDEIFTKSKTNASFINVIQSEEIGLISQKYNITNPDVGHYYDLSGSYESGSIFQCQKVTIDEHSKCYFVKTKFGGTYSISFITLFDQNDNVIGIQPYNDSKGENNILKFPFEVASFAISNTVANGFEIYECDILREANPISQKLGKNLLNTDVSVLTNSSFITSAGNIAGGNTHYSVTDFIPVEPNTAYHLSNASDSYIGASGYVAFYNSNRVLVGTPINTKQFTTPTNTAYLRLTLYDENSPDAMLNKGTSRGDYYPYNPIGGYPVETPGGGNIPDNSITFAKLSEDSGKNQLQSILGKNGARVTVANLTNNTAIEIPTMPYYCKKDNAVSFYSKFTNFSKLKIGKGYNSHYGIWLEIDNTNIVIKQYVSENETTLDTQAHGLTLNTFVKVNIQINGDGKLTYIVQTLGGYYRKMYDSVVWGMLGKTFAISDTDMTECCLSENNYGLQKPIWIFGDSYVAWSNTRWPKILHDWGYGNFMLNGLSGGNSPTIMADFDRCLLYGTPQFAVWCLGMNDGSDTNAETPSLTWANNVLSFISKCIAKGITPILATIPTVPTVNNEAKTALVRASNYRYIDFYKSVGANSNGQWYSGYLSSDMVHPDVLGGQALATQMFIDFPEIVK